jgi:Flp pilus assembly protein TadD
LLQINDRENGNYAQGEKSCGDSKKTACDISFSRLTVDQALDLAFSYYDFGRLLEAEQLCRLILQKIPHQINAMQLLGAVFNITGQYTEAVQLLREAVRQAPGHAHLHNNLGMALHRLEKPDEAIQEFRKALEIRPDFAKAHNNLGAALIKLNKINEAISEFRKAIRLQCNFKEAYNNFGLALKKKGELENAVAAYEKAISIDPKYAEAFSNLGILLIEQNRVNEALENLQKAVNLVTNSAEFHNNLGIAFNRLGRFEEAVAACEKAIAIRSNYVEAHNNLGTALMELGQFTEANAAFEKAIEIETECAQAHHNRALVLLLTAQFEKGWEEYEWRWRHDGFSTPLRPFSQKWWDGSTNGVTKLLIWAEQGIGDEVQFSGLIRHIISRGIKVVVECDQRLVPILSRSFPETVVVGRTNPPATLLKNPSISHQIPMASIPRALGLSPNSMPFQEPFLIPDERERDRIRSEYKCQGDTLLVGISFRSGNKQEGQKRSIGLEQWGPIFNVPGVRFVNLQYGECSKELEVVNNRFAVNILEDKNINPLMDLESFTAQVAAMDLIISVDNSTVHFAGALGVKVWTMLPTVPDWRWGLVGDKTRWYPTMRLFRQAEAGKWEPVIARIAEELIQLKTGNSLVNLNKSDPKSLEFGAPQIFNE